MFRGMVEGWFRKSSDGKPQTLGRYFNASKDDPYNAREIINGDKSKVPSWSGGVSIGKLIAGYHDKFLDALNAAWQDVAPTPEPEPAEQGEVTVDVWVTSGIKVRVLVNGEQV